MNIDEQRAMKDAHTRLAQLPHYSGSICVVFTENYKNVQLGHTVSPDMVRQVLTAMLVQLQPPAPIIVPASAGLPPKGGINGSG